MPPFVHAVSFEVFPFSVALLPIETLVAIGLFGECIVSMPQTRLVSDVIQTRLVLDIIPATHTTYSTRSYKPLSRPIIIWSTWVSEIATPLRVFSSSRVHRGTKCFHWMGASRQVRFCSWAELVPATEMLCFLNGGNHTKSDRITPMQSQSRKIWFDWSFDVLRVLPGLWVEEIGSWHLPKNPEES